MSVSIKLLLSVLMTSLFGCVSTPMSASEQASTSLGPMEGAPSSRFACEGEVEARVWKLWDDQGRQFLSRELVRTRLLEKGDPYALYDIQIQFHNLFSMAERCQRVDRLVQLADDLLPVFDGLMPLGGQAAMRGWTCRGGEVCSKRSRDLQQDEMLASLQGLGILSALANALVHTPDVTARSHPLVARTVLVAIEHLLRSGDINARREWAHLAVARSQDVKNISSELFFTDRMLWQLAIHSNLAGIVVAQPQLAPSVTSGSVEHGELSQAVIGLWHLFERRLTFRTTVSPRLGRATLADLDVGFWRLFAGNRYAGYEGTTKPALCKKTDDGMQVQTLVNVNTVPIVSDLGWDFSHARRLVQVLDALSRNHNALQSFYGLPMQKLPAPELERRFAAQLITKIWNGNALNPLFANYWNGSNGWYRVAVDSSTGVCNPGYPPFGLSSSFPTGGYATWGAYYPVIDELARRVYFLADSPDADAALFIRERYRVLSPLSDGTNRMISQMMFWPSLVR